MRIRSLAHPVDIGKLVIAVAVELLLDVGRIEDIRVVSVAALLAAILRSGFP